MDDNPFQLTAPLYSTHYLHNEFDHLSCPDTHGMLQILMSVFGWCSVVMYQCALALHEVCHFSKPSFAESNSLGSFEFIKCQGKVIMTYIHGLQWHLLELNMLKGWLWAVHYLLKCKHACSLAYQWPTVLVRGHQVNFVQKIPTWIDLKLSTRNIMLSLH